MSYNDIIKILPAINQIKPISTFAKDTFFKNSVVSPSDTVSFEIISYKDGLAHFASEFGASRLVGKSTRAGKAFKLATTKEKIVFSVKEYNDLKALANTIGATDSNDPRKNIFNDYIIQNFAMLADRIKRRQEQMCMAALSGGKITITEEDLKYEWDFGFSGTDGVNVITKSSTAKWDNLTVSTPLEDIYTATRTIAERTGMKADIVLMGKDAANKFRLNVNVLNNFDNWNLKSGTLTPSATANLSAGAQLMYEIPGGISIYEYNQVYTGYDGNPAYMLDTKKVIVTSSEAIQSGVFQWVDGVLNKFAGTDDFTINSSVGQLPFILFNEELTSGIFQITSKGIPIIKSPDPIVTIITY